MAEVLVSSVVDAPADEVWEVVGDFNGFDAWCPFVAGSRITNDLPADAVGCVREITQDDGLKFLEVLVALRGGAGADGAARADHGEELPGRSACAARTMAVTASGAVVARSYGIWRT